MNKFRLVLNSVKADAFLISNPINIYYMSGVKSSFVFLLITKSRNYLLTDSRYFEDAKDVFKNGEVILIKNGFLNLLKGILKKVKVKYLAYEYDYVKHSFFNKVLKNVLVKRLIPTKSVVERFREIKDEEEIKKIKTACSVAEKCANYINESKEYFIGKTEKEIADDIEFFIRKQNCSGCSFPPIIADGKSSSKPHYHFSKAKKVFFEPLLADFGCVFDEYNSDLTRMFAKSTISKKFFEIFDIVKEAQLRAIERIKPGVLARDIDFAARSYIEKCGYGDYFGHALGHGIGLEVHEGPRISPKSKDVLKEKMVFTVEPGIYLPGKFGCRIEDVVLVTKSGCEILTRKKK